MGLALLALAGLTAGPPEAPGQRHFAGSGSTGVLVLDGDTLMLPGGERVRLLGVDSPELGQPLAAEAAAFTRRFLDGQTLKLVPEPCERDRYGRLLADVQVQGKSLSAALLGAGLAWVYRSADEGLLEIQARAVDAHRGVHAWSQASPGRLYRPSARTFHDPRCRLPGSRRRSSPLEENPGCLFKMGLSPCRRCLPWPPVFAAPDGSSGDPVRRSRRD